MSLKVLGILMLGFAISMWGFSISTILGWIVVFTFGIGAYFIHLKEQDGKAFKREMKLKQLDKSIEDIEGFSYNKRFVSAENDTALLIDEKSKRICLAYSSLETKKVYPYKDILESEIVEDNVSVNKVSRTSQIGGAILGGFLVGGVGAIIGGLSGASKTTKEVNRIDLKMIVNDTQNPLYIINFLVSDTAGINGKLIPIKKDTSKYKIALEEANNCHSLISVLIKRADEEDKEKSNKEVESINNSNSSLVADELIKLHNLVKGNIITQNEFEDQKIKLLSK